MLRLLGSCLLLLNTLLVGAEEDESYTSASFYYSYSDATCVDDDTIKGTFVLSWDNADYSAYGYTASYYGGCLYLVDGSMEINDLQAKLTAGTYDYYSYGTCVECDGVVGCSSDGTCSNFKTYPPPETSGGGYQLSQSSSTTKATTAPKYGTTAKKVEESAMALAADNTIESSAPALSGTMMIASAAVGLLIAGVLTILIVRKRRIGNRDLTSAMLEMPRNNALV